MELYIDTYIENLKSKYIQVKKEWKAQAVEEEVYGCPWKASSPSLKAKSAEEFAIFDWLYKNLGIAERVKFLWQTSPCYTCRYNHKMYEDSVCYNPQYSCFDDPKHKRYLSATKEFDYRKDGLV